MDFNIANLPDGTQIRFLDMPSIQHTPMTAEQQAEYDRLIPKLREMSKNCVVSAHTVVDGHPRERVLIQMRRTILAKINAIAKGEQ